MSEKMKFSTEKEEYLVPFRKALKKAREEADTAHISEALSGLGVALFEVEEFEQGAESLDLSISLAQKLGDTAIVARYIGTKGVALAEADNPEPAAQCFQQVIDIADDIGDKGLRCDALGNMGMIFSDTGDAGLALSNLLEAVEIAEELGDLQREMIHVGNLGHAHLLLADIENAMTCFQKALELSRELKDPRSQAGYLTNLGVLAVRLNDQKVIIDIFGKVRKITKELGDIAGEMNALNQLIKAHIELDHKEIALGLTQDARALFKQQDSINGNPYDKTLVTQLFSLNREDEAFEKLQESIEQAHHQADGLRELELLFNQGHAYFDRKMYTEACQSWEKAKDFSLRFEKPQDQARILGCIAAAQAEMGEIDMSILLSHESLGLAKKVEDRRIVGEQQIFLAIAYHERLETEKAVNYCEKAIVSFSEIGLSEFEEKSRQFLQELKSEMKVVG